MSLTAAQTEIIRATVPVLRESGVALTSYFYNRMLTNNPDLKELFNMGHQRSGAQARALAGAVLAYAENIDNLENLGSAVRLMAHKHVSLNIRPEQYAIVGENLLHSISEVLAVPMDSELIAAWAEAYGQLADILIGAEKALYEGNLDTENGWEGWREFEIFRKERESDEITSFYLRPVDGGKVPVYRPGQYISVRVSVPELGLKQPRQYTLSDTGNGDCFRISVKKENGKAGQADGYVSTTLHEHYDVGSVVEVSHPMGDFVLENPDGKQVFISGGVGITPMMAMVNTLLKEGKSAPVSFIYACRNPDVMPMADALQTLRETQPHIRLYMAATEEHEKPVGFDAAGPLDLETLDASLFPGDAQYYICGPKDFMGTHYASLLKIGIPEKQIHMELFNTGGIADIVQRDAA